MFVQPPPGAIFLANLHLQTGQKVHSSPLGDVFQRTVGDSCPLEPREALKRAKGELGRKKHSKTDQKHSGIDVVSKSTSSLCFWIIVQKPWNPRDLGHNTSPGCFYSASNHHTVCFLAVFLSLRSSNGCFSCANLGAEYGESNLSGHMVKLGDPLSSNLQRYNVCGPMCGSDMFIRSMYPLDASPPFSVVAQNLKLSPPSCWHVHHDMYVPAEPPEGWPRRRLQWRQRCTF